MRKKLYGNTVQPSCEHCVYGRKSFDGNAVLCEQKGVMPLYHHCRRYRYDPLKRVPYRQPALATYTEEDFQIE